MQIFCSPTGDKENPNQQLSFVHHVILRIVKTYEESSPLICIKSHHPLAISLTSSCNSPQLAKMDGYYIGKNIHASLENSFASFDQSTMKRMKECYETDKFTDLTLVCGGQEFRCHKVILCCQSPFFDKACTNGFLVRDLSTTSMSDDDPYHVSLMLEFLYTREYTLRYWPRIDVGDPKDVPTTYMSLHTLGDKYEIPALCRFSATKLRDHAAAYLTTPQLLETVPVIYTITPGSCSLRDAVVHELMNRRELQDPTSDNYTLMHSYLREIGGFREDVFRELMKDKWSKRTGWGCPSTPLSPPYSPVPPTHGWPF
ncbi:MAG: hypothetical protein Q9207_006982 [Kuettlingeria erythrocarpa]